MSVDESLNFEGGKQYINDDVESVDSWEDDASDDEDDRVPGGELLHRLQQMLKSKNLLYNWRQSRRTRKIEESLTKAEGVQQNRSRQLNTPIKDDQTDLDFGTYDFVRSLFDFNFGKELSKSNFTKAPMLLIKKQWQTFLKNSEIFGSLSTKTSWQLDAFHWEGGGEGDVVVRKTIEDTNRLFKKDWYNSSITAIKTCCFIRTNQPKSWLNHATKNQRSNKKLSATTLILKFRSSGSSGSWSRKDRAGERFSTTCKTKTNRWQNTTQVHSRLQWVQNWMPVSSTILHLRTQQTRAPTQTLLLCRFV